MLIFNVMAPAKCKFREHLRTAIRSRRRFMPARYASSSLLLEIYAPIARVNLAATGESTVKAASISSAQPSTHNCENLD